jgi:Fur family peroxide stress response transcriptional regulator
LFYSSEEIAAAIHASGRRLTRQRQAIIEYLARRVDHPSARQVFTAVRAGDSRISLATIYNTLSTLVELGFIKEIEFEAEDNRYDTNVSPHINLVCSMCGSITDFDRKPPVSADEIRATFGFDTTGIRMEYHGMCASCRLKNNHPRSEKA